MNVVVLLGTRHSIQRGENRPDLFRTIVMQVCDRYNIKSIAEEIDNAFKTIAWTISGEQGCEYLYADPDREERVERGIPIEFALDIQQKYVDKYPEISMWPSEPNKDNLPKEVWMEYVRITNHSNRMPEKVWLEKIEGIISWPLLFICGADHFDEFSKLLTRSGYQVINSYTDWHPLKSTEELLT